MNADNVITLPTRDSARSMSIKDASDKMRGLPRPVARQIGDLLMDLGADPSDVSKMLGNGNE